VNGSMSRLSDAGIAYSVNKTKEETAQ